MRHTSNTHQDLTTYKVAQKDPILRVDEMTQGGGGLGGSVYLNKRFEDLVQGKIGKQLEGLPKSETLEAMAVVFLSNHRSLQDRLF